jgi:hypothetical protein
MTDPLPPDDLTRWVGGTVMVGIAGAIGAAVRGMFGRGEREAADRRAEEAKREAERKASESEFRSEMRADMKAVLAAQQGIAATQMVQAKDITTLQAQIAALEKRQDAQADNHREAIRALRTEKTP